MKVPDTNIWLALALSGHTHHSAARAWLDEQGAPNGVVFCRAVQQSVLRLLTATEVMVPYGIKPLTNVEAWGVYEAFIADDRIAHRDEPRELAVLWKKLATRRTSSPKLWMDAYLAAFAIACGAQLVTIDKAFTQFPGLDVTIVKAS